MVVHGISEKIMKSKLINDKMKCYINNMNSLVCCSMSKLLFINDVRQKRQMKNELKLHDN